jgi:hypothetical protein
MTAKAHVLHLTSSARSLETIVNRAFHPETVDCPVCAETEGLGLERFDCIHMLSVRINQGGAITEVRKRSTTQLRGEASGRGTLIEIDFACEQGHRFTRAFQFHKGLVYVEDMVKPDTPEGDGYPEELWRD